MSDKSTGKALNKLAIFLHIGQKMQVETYFYIFFFPES